MHFDTISITFRNNSLLYNCCTSAIIHTSNKQPSTKESTAMIEDISMKVNDLASVVMTGDLLEGFYNMPLLLRVGALAVFAHKGGDDQMQDWCLEAMKVVLGS